MLILLFREVRMTKEWIEFVEAFNFLKLLVPLRFVSIFPRCD